MENTIEDIQRIEAEFKACHKILSAIGDETRQHLLCVMLQSKCSGSRVIDIARKTNLSRPAVSRPMQILKNAGIVKARKENTCVYYYLDPKAEVLENLISLFRDVQEIMKHVPDRSGENSLFER